MNLQLALDRLTKEECLGILADTNESVDWIEVGTGVIKEYGMTIVKEIRETYPKSVIVADMKTCDAGRHEAIQAFEAGADITTVMAFSADQTIKDMLEVSRRYKTRVMVDLLGVDDKQRIHQLSQLGIDLVSLHFGKDMQKNGSIDHHLFDLISDHSGLEVAVAGGINLESLPNILPYQPDTLIVGEQSRIMRIAVRLHRKSRRSSRNMKQTIHTVAYEISQVLANVKEEEAMKLSQSLEKAKRIFIVGEGRSGLMGKAFAMRLMHAGYQVYVIGETITPSVEHGDLLLAISGSGSTQSICQFAEKAKRKEAEVAAVTTNADSQLAKLSDHLLVIPAATKKRRSEEPDTIQPLGNQFDQSLHLLLDAVIIYTLDQSKQTNNEEMTARHANLE
ncbi:6-phospho-3-hexuloisomerase [Halobacillus shinanisalinarum]|uniref:3-hexulose-6-phosphate synthase n=1 Tax=Halobacillus shinanisalinarum TaxID=2932258 RepID=A0ABY4H8I3_9BACI|nr:bifunctional 3-hexulose-6-phosphate synthase/6-phospho-3-hexuloisomerase [Halobacillus shinanisalinarum]UOQ95287.1 6-phospho-3-hexuloisomerase [Halobacillus shinanisalinarum]